MATMLPIRPSLGTAIGQGLGAGAQNLGAGISSGLEALANMKLKQLQEQQGFERVKPAYEKLGIDPSAYWLTPQEKAQTIKANLENQMFGQLFGNNVPQGSEDVFGTESLAPRAFEDMAYEELANRLAGAPKKYQDRFQPLLDLKKEEQRRLNKQIDDYESHMRDMLDNVERFNMAVKQAIKFATEHPELYGPYEGKMPTYLGGPSTVSLRKERDRLNDEIVTASLPLEGAIGRGSKLLIEKKEGAKASPQQYWNEYVESLKKLQEIYNVPVRQYQRFSKLQKSGKLKKGFLSKLRNQAIKDFKAAGATVTDLEGLQEVGKTEEMPSAAEAGAGARFYNDQTNEWYESDGQDWFPLSRSGRK